MSSGPEFRTDLYRGTAEFYDAFRIAYPEAVLADLCARARVSGSGRLLDLACGTGQVTFGLASQFTEVWAVDQEPEAIDFARAKARALGTDNVRWIAGRAEDVDTDAQFELVTIGNAFHRLPRRVVAEAAVRQLVPLGHLALLWSNSPWDGQEPWQRVLADALEQWSQVAGTTGRVPAQLDEHLAAEPHTTVLEAAGFTVVGRFDFAAPYVWTVETLTGFMYSTSILSQPALGPHVQNFARDLRARLLEVESAGIFREQISFSYTLAAKP